MITDKDREYLINDLRSHKEDKGLRMMTVYKDAVKCILNEFEVKALGNIIDGNDLACERGESMASWMDSDFRRQAKDTLKEIQG